MTIEEDELLIRTIKLIYTGKLLKIYDECLYGKMLNNKLIQEDKNICFLCENFKINNCSINKKEKGGIEKCVLMKM